MKWLSLLLVVGCGQEASNTDVTGPFTGTPRRYVIDSFSIPTNGTTARELGDDLDGNGRVDNQIGNVLSTLGSFGNLNTHGQDMLASGAIASTFVIRADDYADDPTVSVTYYGSDGDAATRVGGRIEDGVFTSNRTATTDVPGAAIARLPIFVDSAPSDVPMFGLQMTLVPDGDGFDATISGAVDVDQTRMLTFSGLSSLIAAAPDSHRFMMGMFDANRDWTLTYEEVAGHTLMQSLLEPDVTIEGREALSLGFHVHLSPCESGTCTDTPPANTCFDRVKDGNESDVDCGGSCRSCTSGEQCTGPADCESGACDAGMCRAPSCSDDVRDGFESDVDCGGTCGGCAVTARCFSHGDCESGQCGEPCQSENSLDCVDLSPDFDTCRPAP